MANEGQNKRPQIELLPNDPEGEFMLNEPSTKHPVFPEGVFRPYNRATVKSKDPGGFPNAKIRSMLERGYRKKDVIHFLGKGNSGLLVVEGNEMKVSVENGIHEKDGILVLTFKDVNGNIFDIPYQEKWDFYTRTTAVPFVPRPRGRMQRKTRRSRQRGGFYPSVYGGISGAKMLTPLIARQMMRMYETNTRKTRKRKSKKLSRNKRA